MIYIRSRGSSVSIVSDYGLDNRAIGIRFPAGEKDFSSNFYVQTGYVAHPTSCTMGTGGPFPGAKRGRGVTLTTYSHLALRSRMSRSYTSSLPSATWRVAGLLCYDIVTYSWVLFHNGSLLHSKFNTQLLITVHNSSRILTQVQLHRFSNTTPKLQSLALRIQWVRPISSRSRTQLLLCF
jgi:hypothetical protein